MCKLTPGGLSMRNSFLITLVSAVSAMFYGLQSYQHHQFMSLISNSWCGEGSPIGLSAQSFYHCNACNWFIVSFLVTLISGCIAVRQIRFVRSKSKDNFFKLRGHWQCEKLSNCRNIEPRTLSNLTNSGG